MQLKQMKVERCDALEFVPLVGVKTTVSVCLSLLSFHIGMDSFVQELTISYCGNLIPFACGGGTADVAEGVGNLFL
jgi:hypothetical protein